MPGVQRNRPVTAPVRRLIHREVGYVVDSDTVIGEWPGKRWEDIPPKARIYTPNLAVVRERYERGELIARRWRRGTERTYGKITSFEWTNPRTKRKHAFYNLRGHGGTDNPRERFAAVLEFVDWARDCGANIGGLGTTLASIAGTVTDRPHYFREADCPVGRFARGSRIQRLAWPGEYEESTYYDIANAYVSHLTELELPRRLRRYKAGAREPLPGGQGFARAAVVIPPMFAGPLPDTSLMYGGLRFPTDDALDGFWTFDELRAAQAVGCDVYPIEFWTGNYVARPFAGFADVLRDARRRLSPLAMKLVKAGSQAMVGSYATHGQQLRSWYVEGQEHIEEVGGILNPPSLGIHALITGATRAQLYTEGIAPFGENVLAVHTDGVIVQDWERLPENGTGLGLMPGDWDTKASMRRLMLMGAQRYAWEDYEGALHYCVAGIPEDRVAVAWDRWSNGYGYREGDRKGRSVRRSTGPVSVPMM